jgi:hypothetical protein
MTPILTHHAFPAQLVLIRLQIRLALAHFVLPALLMMTPTRQLPVSAVQAAPLSLGALLEAVCSIGVQLVRVMMTVYLRLLVYPAQVEPTL